MSYDDHLRRETQKLLIVSPNAPMLEPYQAPDDHTRQVVNAEIQRVREENDRRWREQNK